MKHVLYACCIVSMALIAACSKDSTSPVSPSTSTNAGDYWMPATTGATLVLEGSLVINTTTGMSDSSASSMTMTVMPGTQKTNDGHTLPIVRTIAISSQNTDTSLVYPYVTSNSILLYNETLDVTDAILILKSPLTVGSSWAQSQSDTTKYVIVGINETVQTPAGSFSGCVHLRATNSDPASGSTSTMEFWMAKGVGLIRSSQQSVSSFGGQSMTIKMTNVLKSKSF